MRIWLSVIAGALALTASTIPAHAQRNDDVEHAQKALKQSGHDPGPIDGVPGPRTTSALKAYQQAQGLEPTGQLDDATRAKLGDAAPAPRSASQTQAGGDKHPAPADPAQASKTGANVGEGASYSRSTQK